MSMEPIAIVQSISSFDGIEEFQVDDATRELITIELAVLQGLDWDLLRSSDSAVVNFIDYMLDEHADLTKFQAKLLKNVLELTYSEREFCCFLPSVVAASVLTVTSHVLWEEDFSTLPWTQPPFDYGHRSQSQHEQCAELLLKAYLHMAAHAQSLSPRPTCLEN